MHIKEVSNMFWGVTLDGGKRYTQTVERAFHLSMAALEPAPEKKKSDSLISVMIQHEKAEFMLCTLEQGRMFQQPLDLNFTEGEEVTFFLSNNNGVVHLTGFLVEDEQYDPDELSAEDFMDVPTSEEEDSDNEVPALIGGHSDDDSDGQKVPAGKKRKKQKDKIVEKKKKKMKLIESDSDEDDDDFDDEDDMADFIDDEADEDSEDDDEEDEEEILKPKKKQKQTPDKKQSPQKKEKTKQGQTPSQKDPDAEEQGEGKKKKKKKKKKKNKEANEQTNTTETPKQQQPKKQVLAGGVVCEDLKVGHGPPAIPGKMVHVYYAGKLQKSGQQFDSCKQGKPFRFRLGKGEVIKGWDTGVSGMKVGGRRKLIVPSQQGYGNSRQGPIPAGSTLEFEVELKAVS